MGNKAGTAVSRRENGATLVEFAIIAPLLFLLIFGVIEFGRVIATQTSVFTAAREAARYATTVGNSEVTPGTPRYLDCDGIKDAAKAKAPLVDLEDDQVVVTFSSGHDCEASQPILGDVPSGSLITVQVTTSFESPLPLISALVGTLDIESTQTRTIFTGES